VRADGVPLPVPRPADSVAEPAPDLLFYDLYDRVRLQPRADRTPPFLCFYSPKEYKRPRAQGLTNLGGLVGIVLALLVTSKPTDWSVVAMARRNGGVYEPEFRLVFMLTMLFGVFGYAGWAGAWRASVDVRPA
jgi:hypothetical protein